MSAGLIRRAGLCAALTALAVGLTSTVTASASTARAPSPETRFFVPEPNPGAVQEIKQLRKAHDRVDARLLSRMVHTPQAVWFTTGTPAEVRDAVRDTMRKADEQDDAVPVLVAFDIPGRDCAQFSAG